ncbi:hypothetical protein V4C53_13895 [Paraburkholderia azotifigens]|uniref:hypothetical protein n=1 Tax=Paraburkholderia azotifigens TaxID=2057004 RepID=UPI00317D8B17
MNESLLIERHGQRAPSGKDVPGRHRRRNDDQPGVARDFGAMVLIDGLHRIAPLAKMCGNPFVDGDVRAVQLHDHDDPVSCIAGFGADRARHDRCRHETERGKECGSTFHHSFLVHQNSSVDRSDTCRASPTATK